MNFRWGVNLRLRDITLNEAISRYMLADVLGQWYWYLYQTRCDKTIQAAPPEPLVSLYCICPEEQSKVALG